MEGLKHGKKPKKLVSDLREKYGNDINSQDYKSIPTTKMIRNLAFKASQKREEQIGMKYLTDITDFIDLHVVKNKSEFEAKGKRLCISFVLIFFLT